jgi:4-amino-4-deoxy-L-arabinose transferase-like glycosyltransferase
MADARTRTSALLLAALAAALLLPNLGGPRLWSDEGDTAVFARTIGERGLPYAWDGRTFTESDRGRRLGPGLVMVGTPWLPYYATAASFALLGESAFAARLPFALAGVAAVVLLYALVLRATGDRRAALAAALLLLASVQFLLFARQSRHYALNMALSLAALLGFLRLRSRPRSPGFAAATALLFHCHPLPAGATLVACGALALASATFRQLRRPFFAWLPAVLLVTLPWLALSWSGIEENSSLALRAEELPARFAQFGVEALAAVPLLGWLLLAIPARARLEAADRAWLLLAGALVGAYLLLTPLLLSTHQLWDYGLRYACALLPLAAGTSGVLLARASAESRAGLAGLMGVFALTHLPGNALLYALAPEAAVSRPTSVAVHVPRGAAAKLFRTEWLGYARELRETDPGTVAEVVDFLARRAGPDDILITNYAWDPIYFHSRLPQGLKVLPEHEIHAAARAAGLPDYVFDVTGARWVVWRWPWNGYQGYELERLRAELAPRGAKLELETVVRETVWENRPELHFHRFPGIGHVFPVGSEFLGFGRIRGAPVFRVVWPAEGEAAP